MSQNSKNTRIMRDPRDFNHGITRMLDSRTSQDLNPVVLPPKVRQKVDKTMKKMNTREGKKPLFGESSEASSKNANLVNMLVDYKMQHFEFIAQNEMVYRGELGEFNEKLTLDQREELSARLQEKMEAITAEVNEKFLQRKQELDAQGLFHKDANIDRAQAMVLVDLQRRLRPHKIHEQALKEMLAEKQARTDEEENKNSAPVEEDNFLAGKLNEAIRRKRSTISLTKRRSTNNFRARLKSINQFHEKLKTPAIMAESDAVSNIKAAGRATVRLAPIPNHGEDINTPREDKKLSMVNSSHIQSCIAVLKESASSAGSKKAPDTENWKQKVLKTWENRSAWSQSIACFDAVGLRERVSGAMLIDTCHLGQSQINSSRNAFSTITTVVKKIEELNDDTGYVNESFESISERRRQAEERYRSMQKNIQSKTARMRATSKVSSESAANTMETPAQSPCQTELDSPLRTESTAELTQEYRNFHDQHQNVTKQLLRNTSCPEVRKMLRNQSLTLIEVPNKTKMGDPGKKAQLKGLHGRHVSERALHRRSTLGVKAGCQRWVWSDGSSSSVLEEHGNESESQADADEYSLGNEDDEDAVSITASQIEHSLKTQSSERNVTSNRTALQLRLENIWSKLETPYLQRIAMLEKYSGLEDVETSSVLFEKAVVWMEKAECIVSILEKMKELLKALKKNAYYIPESIIITDLNVHDLHQHHGITADIPHLAEQDSDGVRDRQRNQLREWIEKYLPLTKVRCQTVLKELYRHTGDEFYYMGALYDGID